MNSVERLISVWRDNNGLERGKPIVQSGVDLVNSFRPPVVSESDEDKLQTMAFALIGAISQEIDGALPKTIFEAVMQALTGAYGLGERCGVGTALYAAAKDLAVSSKDYVNHKTGDTLPSEEQVQTLEDHELENNTVGMSLLAALQKRTKMAAHT